MYTVLHLNYLCLSCYLGLSWWLSSKESPEMQEPQETWVRSPDWEDPLEKGIATHFKILA